MTSDELNQRRTFHPTATLAACILASSLAFIDGSVVNVALPSIGLKLGATPASTSLVVTAYLLPLSSLILLGGALGDSFGRRRMLISGITLFLLASIVCAVAPSITWLVTARVAQGIGAALLMPNSLGILGASFEGEAKGRAVGIWAGVGALASALGPVVGGWLVDQVGWRTIFMLNIPVGLGACALAWAYIIEERKDSRLTPLDWTGAALVTFALGLLTLGLTEAAEPDGVVLRYGSSLVLGFILLTIFLITQVQKGERGLMPLYLMKTAAFIGVTLLTFFLYAALGGLIVLLPYFLIRIEGFSALRAGASLLPIPVLIGLGSRFAGRAVARTGPRLPLSLGSAIVCAGLLYYLQIDGQSFSYATQMLPGTILIAMGMAVSVAPLTTTVMSSVDVRHVGVASGFNSAVARIGGLLATALLAFVMSASTSRDLFMHGFHDAVAIGALLAGLASFSALVLLRSAKAAATPTSAS